MWLSFAINTVLFAIRSAFKNPKKAEELREQLLNVRDAINLLYPESML